MYWCFQWQCLFLLPMTVESRKKLPYRLPRRRITGRHSKLWQPERRGRRRKCLELFLPPLHSRCPQQEVRSMVILSLERRYWRRGVKGPKSTRLDEIVDSYVNWLIVSDSGQTLETSECSSFKNKIDPSSEIHCWWAITTRNQQQ